jgi:hypothetical protein
VAERADFLVPSDYRPFAWLMISQKSRRFWQTNRRSSIGALFSFCVLELVLAGCGPDTSQLITRLKDPQGFVRSEAALELGNIKDPRAVDSLIATLEDPEFFVRTAAVEALGKIKDPRAVDPLIASLKDPDANVQGGAAEALGNIKDPRAVGPLLTELKDQKAYVRIDAAKALGATSKTPARSSL